MVDHHGDVLVMSPVRQLVDTDLREAIESIGTTVAGNDALDDRSGAYPSGIHPQNLEESLFSYGSIYTTRRRPAATMCLAQL
ncbi:MAG TPA: hypothetical protein VF516_06930 [Kofleriaceae bacterium]